MSSLKYLIVGLVFVLMSTGAYATIKPKEDSLRTVARVMEVKYDLPAGLLEAVCEQESNYRNVAGRHGEIGVCQIKPSTVDMIAPGYYKTLTNRVFTFKSTGTLWIAEALPEASVSIRSRAWVGTIFSCQIRMRSARDSGWPYATQPRRAATDSLIAAFITADERASGAPIPLW